MKSRILFFLLFPVLCFAQTGPQAQLEKPATDACPTWNKKGKATSKAEYFQFLKSNKAKDNREVSYRTTPGTYYSSTRTSNVEPRTERGRRMRTNTNSVINKQVETKTEVLSNESIPEEILEKPSKQIQQEELVVEENTIEKKELPAKEKNNQVSKKEKDGPTVNTEKIKKDTKVAGRKVKRFFTRKNKGGKGKAAKCPDF